MDSPLVEDVLFQRVQDRLDAKQAKLPHGTSKREFAFRGLLWCPECGRRFHASHNFGINWYRCGSGETTQQCPMGKNALKESELLPWADKILTWPPLGGTPTRKHEPMQQESVVDAVAKLDRMIKRLGTRFQAEEVTEKEYHSELARLRLQRDAYVAMAATEPDPADRATLAGPVEHR